MRAAPRTSGWGFFGVVTALLLAAYAGCTSQTSERQGGGEVPDLSAGSGTTAGDAGAASEAGAGGALGEAGAAGAATVTSPVTWCAAYEVIACVCQQCHQNPPLHQAPIPLMTYDDTQAPFPFATSQKKVWQEMQAVVSSGSMPYLRVEDPPVTPPVEPLSAVRKATLLTWLAEGAHDEGGQNCLPTCDWTR